MARGLGFERGGGGDEPEARYQRVMTRVAPRVVGAYATLARVHAELTDLLAEAGDASDAWAEAAGLSASDAQMQARATASELGALVHLSDRGMQSRIIGAQELVHHYPATLAALRAGAMTPTHAETVRRAGGVLPAGERAAFDAEAAAIASATTPARAKHRLDLLAQELHPVSLAARHARAAEERHVRILPCDDGMAEVRALVPLPLAAGIRDRLQRMARAHAALPDRPPEDARTIDQLCADIFQDLLLTGMPSLDAPVDGDGPGTLGAIRARVQIAIPALGLLEPAEEGRAEGVSRRGVADLLGYGPIDIDTAEAIAGATRSPWVRVVTHPVTAHALHTDTYARTSSIDRFVRVRDQHCRFPGCRVPAIRTDVDHTVPWAEGGQTTASNLACLCRRHHWMKGHTRWRVAQLGGGVLEWTSPLGHVYREHPPAIHGGSAPPVPTPTPRPRPAPARAPRFRARVGGAT